MSLRGEIERVLTESGLDVGGSLHGWRCEYPDRYGPCTCLAELTDELVIAVVNEGI